MLHSLQPSRIINRVRIFICQFVIKRLGFDTIKNSIAGSIIKVDNCEIISPKKIRIIIKSIIIINSKRYKNCINFPINIPANIFVGIYRS
jgi:hypothetical protein